MNTGNIGTLISSILNQLYKLYIHKGEMCSGTYYWQRPNIYGVTYCNMASNKWDYDINKYKVGELMGHQGN